MTFDEKQFLKIQNELENIIASEQDQVLKIYAQSYKKIISKIKSIYKTYAKDGKIENADKAMLNRLSSIEKECIQELSKTHKQVEAFILERTHFAYGESFFKNAYHINENLHLNVDWGVIPKSAVEVAAFDNYALLVKSQTFKNASKPALNTIREVFSHGLIEGQSYEKIRDQLIKAIGVYNVSSKAIRYVGHGISAWAMTVARTEAHRAMSIGQKKTEQICKDNNVDIEWVWCATLDGNTRAEHGALDGVIKDEEHNGWYVPSIGWVKGPGLSGVARFDINCRCCVIPRIKGGKKSTQRYIRGEGVTKYKTYTEWRKGIFEGPRGEFKFDYHGDEKIGKDLKSTVMKTLANNDTALKSVSDLNYQFLKHGRAKYTFNGKIDGKERSFANAKTINISKADLYANGPDVIAHEVRHFIEFNTKETKAIKEAREYFEHTIEKTLKVIQPNDSRWDKLVELESKTENNISLSDLISIVSDRRILTMYCHKVNEVEKLADKAKEISANLHSIATTDKKLYSKIEDILDELTDGFEQYTISLTKEI